MTKEGIMEALWCVIVGIGIASIAVSLVLHMAGC